MFVEQKKEEERLRATEEHAEQPLFALVGEDHLSKLQSQYDDLLQAVTSLQAKVMALEVTCS